MDIEIQRYLEVLIHNVKVQPELEDIIYKVTNGDKKIIEEIKNKKCGCCGKAAKKFKESVINKMEVKNGRDRETRDFRN